MESENGRVYQQPLAQIPRSSFHSYFAGQSLRSGYMGLELVRPQVGYSEVYGHPQNVHHYPHSQPFAPSHFHEFQELLLRELQKEQIRKEMIISEILSRRRSIVSGVRREMILDQELAPRIGNDGPLLGSTSAVGFNASASLPLLGPRAEEWALGGRVVPSLIERERRLSGRNETGGYEVVVPRGTSDLRISEVNPASQSGKEKERTILQANHEGNISGVKRKDLTPLLSVDAGQSSLDDPLRKKAKSDWICAICNVSTTSEQGLNDHLQGKKHKSREAAMKMRISGKNYCIGFRPKKATKSVQVLGPANLALEDHQKFPSPSLCIEKAGESYSEINDAPKLRKSQNSKASKKDGEKVVKRVRKNNVQKKEKFRFWCETCKVGATSEVVMNEHIKGRKHVSRAQQCNQNGGAGPSNPEEKVLMMSTKSVSQDTSLSKKTGQKSLRPVDINNPAAWTASLLKIYNQ